MPETPALRLTPAAVRAILARHPGWTLEEGITLDLGEMSCCPLGAAVLDLAPEAAAALDIDDDSIRIAARILGLDSRYADGFASAFDGYALTAPHSLSPEYQTGHADGAACRAELLTTGKEG